MEYEALDAECELDAFELTESVAKRQLRIPQWVNDGIGAGRLTRRRGNVRLAYRRLSYRSYSHFQVVMRAVDTGMVIRLPFA